MSKTAEKPRVKLTQGPPGLNLPNLNEARRMNPGVPKISPPVSAPFASKVEPSATAPPSMQENNWPMDLLAQVNRVGTGGEDLLSRNYNWGRPIVSLPGRAGMDLNLGLSLNSLIWTKSGTNIYFNLDKGFPSPGFHLGFPELGVAFYNTETATGSMLVTMPSGMRYEFRANPSLGSNVYEEMGGTHMLLVVQPGIFDYRDTVWTLLLTDGAAFKFKIATNNPKCVEIKDSNGNYISITYTPFEQISAITDTLGRVVNYKYDGSNRLVAIAQDWSGGTHNYATFAYDIVTIQTNFLGLDLVGAANGTTISVLSRVDMAGGKVYAFEYNTYAQVKTIRCYAPSSANPVNFPGDYTLLSSISYDLTPDGQAGQTDCPRFSSRRDWAKDWNAVTENGAISIYNGDGATWGSATAPDGTEYKEFFGASGWQRGLTLRTEIWSNGSKKKWTDSTWANDNPNVSYWLNPRVVETNVRDEHGGRRRTTIDYADFGAVSDIREYGPVLSDWILLRHTHFDYLRGTAYTGNLKRRLTQLVTSQKVFDGGGALQSKVTYQYDLGGQCLVDQGQAIRHDTTNFGLNFIQGRGNLNAVRRWDVTAQDDVNKSVASTVGYNTSGSVIFSRDPLNHQKSISYTDSFSDSVNRNTLAYPTRVTDADNYSSTVQYIYDFGAVKRSQEPKGEAAVNTYDSIGRLERITNQVNDAYTRYVYAPNHLYVQSYTTVNDLSSEFYQISVFDGHGRMRGAASDLPGSVGGYRAQNYEYNIMGRLVRQTNPTEIDVNWSPKGDDTGWVWSSQSYDWQGRLTDSTNQDGTTTSISYEGCACAGGHSMSTFDEMGRKQTAFYDVLGRLSKTQAFNWDGTTVYSTAINTYNARDQVIRVRAFKGAGAAPGDESCPAGLCQETVMGYDGHGRLSSRKRPEEGGSGTVYTYYNDGLMRTATDARGASSTFSYNARHLTTNIAYSSQDESAVPNTPSVSFQYDQNGNRTEMNDGAGTVTYGYNTLGLLTSETREFSELVSYHFVHKGTGQPIQTSYQIGYSYNIGRQLQSITTPTGDTIDYARDKAGRITRVSGTPRDGVADYVSDIDYRAWGAEKRYDFGYQNYSITMSHNARMQVSQINDQDKLAANYTYTDDGRISAVRALNDRRLDRTFSYDHVGRVTATRSASEAGLGSAEPAQLRQDYGYDEFNHMTLRQGKYWYTGNNTFSATYTNNIAGGVIDRGEAQNWQYDAEGNVTSEGGKTHTYDAVGRQVKTTSTDTFHYDGDGRFISQTYINPPPSTNPTGSKSTYYLWSTVLNENLAEIRLDGDASNAPGDQKSYHRDVFIYVNGQQVAVRKYDQGAEGSQPNLSSQVAWNHRDPLNTIARSVDSAGGSTYSVDPTGMLAVTASQNEINAYWAPSPSPYQPPRGFYSSANFGTHGMGDPGPGNWGLGCKVDGVQTPCGIVLGGLRTGGVGNVVGGTGVTIGAGPLMPEVISAISTFAMAGNVRTRIVPKTIPGAGTGLKMGIAGGDIPASQDVPATTSYVVVTEYVGAISGFPVLGGDGIGQQGGGTGSAPACGLLGDPKYEDAIKKALKKAPKPKSVPGAGAGIFGKLGKALGVIWTVLVDLEGQGPSPEADSPKYPKFVITHRYTKGLGAGEFKPKMREISTFEKKSTDPEVKFNVPFLGVYYGEKEKWQLAKILGVPEVPGLWARYTPTDEGEAHWDLLVPVGMSDDKFKEGLSAYARRILDKPLPPCK